MHYKLVIFENHTKSTSLDITPEQARQILGVTDYTPEQYEILAETPSNQTWSVPKYGEIPVRVFKIKNIGTEVVSALIEKTNGQQKKAGHISENYSKELGVLQ